VNTHGGVNGHPVKLFQEDDGGNATQALQLAKKLVEQDHVIAFVGESSLADGSFMSYLASKDVPVVGGASVTQSTFRKDPNVFISGATKSVLFYSLLKTAKDAGQKSFSSLHCIEIPSCSESVPIFQAADNVLGGIAYTGAKFSLTAPDYTAPCFAAKNAGVDALLPSAGPAAVIKFVKDCSAQGYKPAMYNLTPNAATSLLTADPVTDGMILASPNANYVDTSIPAVKEFLDALDAYDPSIRSGQSFPYTTIATWAGGKLFEAAAKAGNLSSTSTGEDVKKGLYALKDETLGGLAPPLNFAPGVATFPTCSFLVKVSNKTFVSMNGGKPVCVDPAVATELSKINNG
jgi:branched-chain amino acid transport system substrate-binding protein